MGFPEGPKRNPKEQGPKPGQPETTYSLAMPFGFSLPDGMGDGIETQVAQSPKFAPYEGFGRPWESGVKEGDLT